MSLQHMRNHLHAFTLSTAAYMLANNVEVRAVCWTCGRRKAVDIAALNARTSGGYSLINRRCRCRLTVGCDGWNVFEYRAARRGDFLPLYDLATQARWAGVTLPKWPAFPIRLV